MERKSLKFRLFLSAVLLAAFTYGGSDTANESDLGPGVRGRDSYCLKALAERSPDSRSVSSGPDNGNGSFRAHHGFGPWDRARSFALSDDLRFAHIANSSAVAPYHSPLPIYIVQKRLII
jgi:hypothetical protein